MERDHYHKYSHIRQGGRRLLAVTQSVLAAAFGVQSDRKRREDFQDKRPGHFIIAGIIFTVLFTIALGLLAGYVTS